MGNQGSSSVSLGSGSNLGSGQVGIKMTNGMEGSTFGSGFKEKDGNMIGSTADATKENIKFGVGLGEGSGANLEIKKEDSKVEKKAKL